VNPTNFLTELKRRNVYRAAVAYGVVAWFLTQLTTQVLPLFEIPNSAVRFVVIALAVGFPIAMLLLPLRIHPRRNRTDRRSPSDTGEIGQHYNNYQQHPDNDEVQDPSDGTLNRWSTPVLPADMRVDLSEKHCSASV
jgi:hypothetical protein